ncbi:MAG: aspartate kinase [Acidimicrobiia bacterium]|nr:aspartate kinase [Acidimicrobiia bacterium]
MTETVVQKYGGSSVADVPKLERVADRVIATAKQGRRVCVVVSAMGRTTDDLIRLAKQISDSPPRRELDMLLSTGERITMALLAMAIQKRGFEAISFTGSQSGIITNDRHSGAHIIEVRPIRIQDELERGRIVIVAGFQGMSYRREITTLGRGGSDTTAVALAAALGASCEICSDVDGVYTADPRIVSEAHRLDSISYEEMQELAEHGAKVLNAQAVEWARRSGIHIYARATHAEGVGTRVGNEGSGREACGVATATGLVRLHLKGRSVELGAALAEGEVPLWQLTDDGTTATALFGVENLPDWAGFSRALRDRFGAELEVVENLAAVSVVGTALGSAQLPAQAIQEAGRLGAKIVAIDTSPLRITVLVHPSDAPGLARALHAAFIAAG